MSSGSDISTAITLINQQEYQNALSILSIISSSSKEWQLSKRQIKNILITRHYKHQISDEALSLYMKLFLEKGDKKEADEIARLIPNHPEAKKLLEKYPIARLNKFIRYLYDHSVAALFGTIFGLIANKLGTTSATIEGTTTTSVTSGNTAGGAAIATGVSTKTVIVLAAIALSAVGVAVALQRPPSLIAFTSNRDGDFEIYTANVDGTAIKVLTQNSAYDTNPNWCKDGSKIIFTSNRDGNFEIYLADSDGANPQNLTRSSSSNEDFAQFSPNCEKIIFNSNRDGDNEIFIMKVDGSNQTQLTFNDFDDYWATWNLDGKEIFFSSGVAYKREICVMRTDGSNLWCLTNNSADDIDPILSPNGETIAFMSNETGKYQPYVMDTDGLSRRAIFPFPSANILHSDWSPDGSQLVVMANLVSMGDFSNLSSWGNNYDLYVVNVDGSGWEKITHNAFDDGSPDWSS